MDKVVCPACSTEVLGEEEKDGLMNRIKSFFGGKTGESPRIKYACQCGWSCVIEKKSEDENILEKCFI